MIVTSFVFHDGKEHRVKFATGRYGGGDPDVIHPRNPLESQGSTHATGRFIVTVTNQSCRLADWVLH